MNRHEKKISKVLTSAMTDDLTAYGDIIKHMKKSLGLPFFGTKKIAAALLKEYLGDVSDFEYDPQAFKNVGNENLVFEDIKDGKIRLFMNIGKSHKIVPGDIIREIVKRSGIDGKVIGKIDIHQNYSFIEIPEQYAEIVLMSFDNVRFRGSTVVLEPAKKKKNA
ncbi:MAG: DbpA RNA binding domain-containing protein [Spirochaetota bacterium]